MNVTGLSFKFSLGSSQKHYFLFNSRNNNDEEYVDTYSSVPDQVARLYKVGRSNKFVGTLVLFCSIVPKMLEGTPVPTNKVFPQDLWELSEHRPKFPQDLWEHFYITVPTFPENMWEQLCLKDFWSNTTEQHQMSKNICGNRCSHKCSWTFGAVL